MPLPAQTVLQFVTQSYQLVTASTPTVGLMGNDFNMGLILLNQLVTSYSGTGQMLTIAKEVFTTIQIGQQFVTFADPAFIAIPPMTINVPEGRLANVENIWLLLDGVTYPMWDESRNSFFSSYKYEPLQGLPRFGIIVNNIDYTTMQIYPAPSQPFELHIFGKFELSILGPNDNMSGFPSYYLRYLQFALAREIAVYKGRNTAWTPLLQSMYQEAYDDMVAVTPVNLNIESDYESLLNGSWRVRAGV
jgi:hypothetical protein